MNGEPSTSGGVFRYQGVDWTYSYYVIEISESQHEHLGELLAGISESIGCDSGRQPYFNLGGATVGGIHPEERLAVFVIPPLTTRFAVAGLIIAPDTELRDTGWNARFDFNLNYSATCDGEHTSHSNGDPRHALTDHSRAIVEGPRTAWIPIADLLDDNVAAPPAEAPEAPAEPTAPTDNAAALAQLQAELDAARRDLSAARDSVDALLEGSGTEIVTLYDTVEVATHDTLLYCPPSDDDRRDLFDLFTGADDDTTETGGAGKTASVQLESWGAIKSLIQE